MTVTMYEDRREEYLRITEVVVPSDVCGIKPCNLMTWSLRRIASPFQSLFGVPDCVVPERMGRSGR